MVTDIDSEHNHATSEALYHHLSSKPAPVRKKWPSKSVLAQQDVEASVLTVVQDGGFMQHKVGNTEQVARAVQEKYEHCSHLLSEETVFHSLHLCTDRMQKIVAACPEFLAVTVIMGTLSAYVLHVEDGNGHRSCLRRRLPHGGLSKPPSTPARL